MQTSSNTSLAPRFLTEPFRAVPRSDDLQAVEVLTRATGVFSEDEVLVARELVEETLERGEAASGYYHLFADGEGRLDGYACFGPIPMTANRYELYWIAVHPDAKRSGVGRLLAHAVEEWVRGERGTHIFCATSTRPEYWAARAFYEAQGFAQMADIADYHAGTTPPPPSRPRVHRTRIDKWRATRAGARHLPRKRGRKNHAELRVRLSRHTMTRPAATTTAAPASTVQVGTSWKMK